MNAENDLKSKDDPQSRIVRLWGSDLLGREVFNSHAASSAGGPDGRKLSSDDAGSS